MTRYQAELYHYGVKGMKWGIRRTKEQLLHDKGSITSVVNHHIRGIKTATGIPLTAFSDHAGDQARDRKVAAKDILDALQNPLHTGDVKHDGQGRPSQLFIGQNATVGINPINGVVCTVWITGKRRRKKYGQ